VRELAVGAALLDQLIAGLAREGLKSRTDPGSVASTFST